MNPVLKPDVKMLKTFVVKVQFLATSFIFMAKFNRPLDFVPQTQYSENLL